MMLAVGALGATASLQWLYFPGIGGICGLLAGSALALTPVRLPRGFGLAAFAVLLAACFQSPDWTHQAFWQRWIQLATIASVIVVAWLVSSPDGLFSSRPAVWLGKRSYAIYLFHSPVRAVLLSLSALSASKVTAIGLVVTILLAAVSYRVVELPFLRLKDRFRGQVAVTPSAA